MSILILHCLLYLPTAAQWQSLAGPEGGTIALIFEDLAGTLYAANGENVFVRKSGQNSWERVVTPFGNSPVLSITQSPSGSMFFGIDVNFDTTHSIYRTDSDLTSWHSIPLAKGKDIRAMIHTTDGKLIIGQRSSVLISNDNGMTAIESSVGDDLYLQQLREDGNNQLVATSARGLYYADLEELNWRVAPSLGADYFLANLDISAINAVCVIDLDKNQVLFADSPENEFRDITSNLADFSVSSIRFDDADNLFASTQNGKIFIYAPSENKWTEFYNSGGAGIGVMTKSSIGDLIFAQANDGLWRINEDGQSHSINEGLFATDIMSMVNIGDDLLVSTRNSLYKWESTQSTWLEILVDKERFVSRSMISVTPSKVLASSNSGIHLITLDVISAFSESLGLDDFRVIFAVQDANGIKYTGTHTDGLFVYDDKDSSWLDIRSADMRNSVLAAMIVTTSGNLLVGANRSIFISEDDGKTWNMAIDDIPSVKDFTMDAKGNVYAAAASSILKSEDEGKNWTSYSVSEERPIYRLLAASDGLLYAGMERSGIYISDDQGETWNEYSEGLTTSTILNLLESENGNIFAGSAGGGVFLLENSTTVIDRGSPSEVTIEAFPNPVRENLQIRLTTKPENDLKMRLQSMQGHQILKKRFSTSSIIDMISIPMTSIPNGCYFLTIEANGQTSSRKIVKVN